MLETIEWDREPDKALLRAVDCLRRGGIVAYPTETFYGLGVRALDGEARERLTHAKRRALGKALPCIVASVEQLRKIARLDDPRISPLIERFWPGPLTLVLPTVEGAREILGDSVAARVSSHPVAMGLSTRLGEPIVSTSANPSGQPAPTEPDEVVKSFRNHLGVVEALDLLIDAGSSPGGMASTILSLEDDGLRLLRAGAISERAILATIAGSG